MKITSRIQPRPNAAESDYLSSQHRHLFTIPHRFFSDIRKMIRHRALLLTALILFPVLFTKLQAQGSFPRDGNEELAMRIHDWYAASQDKLTKLQLELPRAERNAKQFINMPGDHEDLDRWNQMKADIETEKARISKLVTAWEKNRTNPPAPARSFAGRYGALSESLKPGSDPGVDQVKAAILHFPFNDKVNIQTTGSTSYKLELPGYWGHLSYTISGGQFEAPTGSDRGNVGGRQYKGKFAGKELTVTGTAVSDNESSGPGTGDYYELVVSVTVGKENKKYNYIAAKGEKLNKPFSMNVPIDRNAISGSFTISLLEQNANYGPHGWVVSGYLTNK